MSLLKLRVHLWTAMRDLCSRTHNTKNALKVWNRMVFEKVHDKIKDMKQN